ncbi:MAG: hypothetical protein H6R18_1832 [Proteobacteria bacterium]|nr:hypothetical protein [Pseudomonadota bacterium]
MKTLLAALLLAAGCLGNANAGNLVDIQIVDRTTGQTLETYHHRGRLYVAGAPGNRYAVRIYNRSGARVMTVLSVDGVNAVTGQTASPSQSGYVLSAGQTTEIAGWRKSMDEVAAFYFTNIADSYAARTDRPQNVGVIGVAVFQEYAPPPPPPIVYAPRPHDGPADMANDTYRSESAKSRAASPQAASSPGLGTGHGERVDSRVTNTEFRRASSRPYEVISFYYDSHANLVARGIIPQRHHGGYGRPNPFPSGFVPDPNR